MGRTSSSSFRCVEKEGGRKGGEGGEDFFIILEVGREREGGREGGEGGEDFFIILEVGRERGREGGEGGGTSSSSLRCVERERGGGRRGWG